MKPLVIALFLLSGACGLVYQVVWTRLMTHAFGGTALAIGTVLAAFMTGLAVGGWRLGKLADRVRNPLRLYAWLEFGVAVTAAIAHVLLTHLTPAYLAVYEAFGRSAVALAVARFVMAFVLVMGPTVLMGATLPVLTRFVVRRISAVGTGLSTLYAINTIGAVGGAVAAGFILIGALGVHGTALVAILGNVAAGAVAWIASRGVERAPAEAPAAGEERAAPRPELPAATPAVYRLVLAGLAVSGLTSFAYEIYWSRSLVFITGNSTYALTTTLAAFLTGIALGGYLIRFPMRRAGDPVALFGWLQVLIALTAAAAMPLLFTLVGSESIRERLWASADRVALLAFARFGVAFLVMVVPALLIGATFPLVGRMGVKEVARAGASVGRVYAVNTAGNVLGALLPGLVLLHWLGIQRGVLVMAGLNLAVGLAVLLSRLPAEPRRRWVAPAALGAAVAISWSAPLGFEFPLATDGPSYRVLYQRDGPSATTAVLRYPDTREKAMTLDGICIGGTGATDYKQQILAHLPKLLLDDVSEELSVGLGSGILIGESARHARVERITCVEIEPTVVEGAGWFSAESGRVTERPGVEIVVDDIASHLRTTSNRYDVVSADEKTAPEYASNGFSYSREYYEMIRDRLKPGGLVIQWVPTSLPHRQYRMVLRTFCEAFPHVLVWYFGPALTSGAYSTFLVGSKRPIAPDLDRARRWMAADSAAFAGLARYGLTTPEAVFAQLWTNRDVLYPAVADAPQNTLAHPRYEFYAPGDYAVPPRGRLAENFEFLLRLRRVTPPDVRGFAAARGAEDRVMLASEEAESEYLLGQAELLRNAPPEGALAHLERAIARTPGNRNLRARVFAQYWDLANRFAASGNPGAVAELRRLGLLAYGEDALGHVDYSLALDEIGDADRAIEAARRALALDPELIAGHRVLAAYLFGAGRGDEARAHLRAILALEPEDAGAREMLQGL